MIDLNTLISNALIAAVQQAVAPLNERVTALESVCATQHEAMVAMRDRITALEDTGDRLYARIAALENNPAQGVEPAITIDEARMVEALNSQEWFWEKLQNRIDAATESAIDMHCETYDHDNYDEVASKVDDLPDLDDYVTRDSVREEIEDVLNNATLSLSI